MKKKNRDTITIGSTHPGVAAAAAAIVRLDIGCGPHKKEGFTGVDAINFPGVDVVADLKKPWPFNRDTVDEIHSSHFIEHFDAVERVHVYNEMFRVMKVGAKATLYAPAWQSGRAYGDPTHKWPPIAGFSFYYLLKDWREANAPHTDYKHWPAGYKCDFDATWGWSMHQMIASRNPELQQFALNFYIEAAQDIVVTLVKRPAVQPTVPAA